MLDQEYPHIVELPSGYAAVDKLSAWLNNNSVAYKYADYRFRFADRNHACALLLSITYHANQTYPSQDIDSE